MLEEGKERRKMLQIRREGNQDNKQDQKKKGKEKERIFLVQVERLKGRKGEKGDNANDAK